MREIRDVEAKTWWVYIIATARGSLYTGITLEPERRFREHMATFLGTPGARGAKYFRSVRPLAIVYRQAFANRGDATRCERAIKKMPLPQKRQLIDNDSNPANRSDVFTSSP